MKVSVELDGNIIQSVSIVEVSGANPTVVVYRNSNGDLAVRKVKRFFAAKDHAYETQSAH